MEKDAFEKWLREPRIPKGYRPVNAGGTLVREFPRIRGKKARKQAKQIRRQLIARARARGHEVVVAPWKT